MHACITRGWLLALVVCAELPGASTEPADRRDVEDHSGNANKVGQRLFLRHGSSTGNKPPHAARGYRTHRGRQTGGAAAESLARGRNLVVTMAAGYPLWRHRRFVLSLRQSGYTGDVTIFLDAASHRNGTLLAFLAEHRVKAVAAASVPVKEDGFVESRPKLLRYRLYEAEASRPEYADGLILLIDFRDVVFQADPFAGVALRGEWLRFYEEVYPPSMEDSYYTFAWIKECWGEQKARPMAKAVIVCSGATMGTAAGVRHYANTMLDAMRTAPSNACMTVPHDQRFHNYLLYTGQFERVRVLRAGNAEVYNMGYLGRKDRATDGIDPARFHHIDDVTMITPGWGLVVLNDDGSTSAVLHQYDRFKPLEAEIAARYDG